MKIYLMRHGETDLNKERCFYGSFDASINAKGRQQASLLYKKMKAISVSVVYVSGLRRTLETAQLAFDRQIPLLPLEKLNEKDFGRWECMRADDIEKAYPEEWEAWLQAPLTYTPQSAEAFATFKKRVLEQLESLLIKHASDTIAIVGHLGVLRLIYQYMVDPEADFWDIDFPQGTVTLISKEDDQVIVEQIEVGGGHR